MSNETKKTAVEWLIEQLEQHHVKIDIKNTVVYQQAKEMEKERMIEFAQSYAVIHCMGDITKNAEQYYNETYGGNKWE